ncbi:MAG: site-specific integrase [Candidatus Eremiobacteraeota bacterium]|nr:site-specific integrase [Candidatus Eremiobacteraeota bacterium]
MKNGSGRAHNGRGTVYAEGAKHTKPTGFFVAELQYTDENGREHRRSARRKTRKEADNALDKMRIELAAKGAIEKITQRRGLTFEAYAQKWLDQRKAAVRPATFRAYAGNLKNHLLPFFGQYFIKQISKDDVNKFVSSPKTALAHKAGRKDGTSVRKQSLRTLAMILRAAVDDGVLERMPISTSGHNKVAVKHDPDEVVFLNEEQQRRLLKACSGSRLEALYILAVGSGMREGELLGLRWHDVQADHVVVTRRLDQVSREREPTKTRAAVRRVDLPAAVLGALRAHQARMQKEGLSVGSEHLVFQNTVGRPISATNFTKREFKPIVKAAGLPTGLRFHDLRHSHASHCIAQGVNLVALQHRLGHESVTTTLRHYGHLLPTTQQEAAGAVAALFEARSEEPNPRLNPRRGSKATAAR